MRKRLLPSFIAASPLAPHTCSQSTVTQKKNKRQLATFMFIGSRVAPPPPQTRILGGGASPTFWSPTTLLPVYMYLTIPVTSVTSQCTFSALRQPKNYQRSTMTQDRQNNCQLMHWHKSIMDTLDTVKIACANE